MCALLTEGIRDREDEESEVMEHVSPLSSDLSLSRAHSLLSPSSKYNTKEKRSDCVRVWKTDQLSSGPKL